MKNKIVVLILDNRGLNREIYSDYNAAMENIVENVAKEIHNNPGYTKWVNNNKIAVINVEKKNMLSMRVIIGFEDYLNMINKGEIYYEKSEFSK